MTPETDIFNSKIRAAAVRALRAWFKSQNLSDADAGILMMDLEADALVEQTKNPLALQIAINMLTKYLTYEVAVRLRGDTK